MRRSCAGAGNRSSFHFCTGPIRWVTGGWSRWIRPPELNEDRCNEGRFFTTEFLAKECWPSEMDLAAQMARLENEDALAGLADLLVVQNFMKHLHNATRAPALTALGPNVYKFIPQHRPKAGGE